MNLLTTDREIPELSYDERGLLPVVTQDADSGEVLMLAYADRQALEKTLATGEAHYFSRSRQELWRKGATSGNTQQVTEVRYDCDADALLYLVRPAGPACHTGRRSCFYRTMAGEAAPSPGAVLALLERVVVDRLERLPESSYVARLHKRGLGYTAQKVIEEAGESIIAALEGKDEELLGETADLLFHLTVLLHERGTGWREVAATLLARHEERAAGDS